MNQDVNDRRRLQKAVLAMPLTNMVSWRSIPPPLRGSFNMLGFKEIKWTMRG